LLLKDVAKLEESFRNLQSENGTMLDYLKSLEQQIEVTRKEAEEQGEKYKRAKAQLIKLEKEMKSTQGYAN
jgi:peptidoglycan hydrolase CwlO-like protein